MAMARASRLEAWDRTAFLAALLRNLWRGRNQRAVRPDEMNPYRTPAKRGIRIDASNIRDLKVLINRGRRR